MLKKTYDTIVIGLGGAGSSAVYHLSKTGRKVLGLEKFKLNHANGSSHGDSRIIRRAYFEGEYYVPLAKRAYELFDKLEAETGNTLFKRVGCLNIGKDEDKLVERSKFAADKHNIDYQIMTNGEINSRYPFFNIDDKNYSGLLESNAGYLHPELCVQSHLAIARKNKADVLEESDVKKIDFDKANKTYTITTNKDTFISKEVVIASGTCVNDVLKNFNLKLPVTIDLNYLYYFKFKDGRDFQDFPVFLISNNKQEFYGFPNLRNGNWFKVSLYHHYLNYDDYSLVERAYRKDNEDSVFMNCEKFIKGFSRDNIELVKYVTCLYTSTKDKDFVIDYLPDNDNVVLVSACSGHGFKFTSAVGEMAMNLLDRKVKPFDYFKLNRLFKK
jgi:monomeric sarcosine oxidase